MRSICPLSVCSSGEYVYVTAEPISLPPSPSPPFRLPLIFPSVPRRLYYPPHIGYCSFSPLCIPRYVPLSMFHRLFVLPSSSPSPPTPGCTLRDSVGLIPTVGQLAFSTSPIEISVSLQRSASLPCRQAACYVNYTRVGITHTVAIPPGASPSAAL